MEAFEELNNSLKTLESIKEADNISLELLDEINDILQYMLGWCHGWQARKM